MTSPEYQWGREIFIGDKDHDFKGIDGQDYDKLRPVWRNAILRTAEPTRVYLPPLSPGHGYHTGLSWIFDIMPAFDPPPGPTSWWGYATNVFPRQSEDEVFLTPLTKSPPDATLTFDAFTAENEQWDWAKERLLTVVRNVLTLARVQVNPVPAQRLMHPTPEGYPPLG